MRQRKRSGAGAGPRAAGPDAMRFAADDIQTLRV